MFNKERESLRLWLEAVSPGSSRPSDNKYHLVWKLAIYYGATPSNGDLLVPLIKKLRDAIVAGGGGGSTSYLIDHNNDTLVDEASNNLIWA